MKLALREMRRRPGRFATSAALLTLIAMLLMFLGGLLDGLIARSTGAKHRARVGLVEEVVVEGPSKKDPTVTTGRTPHNKLIHFATSEPLRAGTFARVRVAEAGAHHLLGDLVEVTARPRHRARIPVVAG